MNAAGKQLLKCFVSKVLISPQLLFQLEVIAFQRVVQNIVPVIHGMARMKGYWRLGCIRIQCIAKMSNKLKHVPFIKHLLLAQLQGIYRLLVSMLTDLLVNYMDGILWTMNINGFVGLTWEEIIHILTTIIKWKRFCQKTISQFLRPIIGF